MKIIKFFLGIVILLFFLLPFMWLQRQCPKPCSVFDILGLVFYYIFTVVSIIVVIDKFIEWFDSKLK